MANGPGGAPLAWRTVDIIVTAVLGVAFGVVFFVWNNIYPLFGTLFGAYPPAQALFYGMWMLPGVLCMLVVRKAGAAVFGSTVAATVSVFFGAPQPLMIVFWGLMQGVLPESIFLATRYRRFGLGIAVPAATVAGLWAGVLDPVLWMPEWPTAHRLAYLVFVLISSAVIGGLGAGGLVRALRPTGVLAPFPSGGRAPAELPGSTADRSIPSESNTSESDTGEADPTGTSRQ